MKLQDYFAISLRQLVCNPLRTCLAVLGIIIGTASMIAVLSIGQTGMEKVDYEMNGLGIDRVWIYPNVKENRVLGNLQTQDAAYLQEHVQGVLAACPIITAEKELYANGKTYSAQIVAGNKDIHQVEDIRLLHGRLFTKEQCERGENVILLGSNEALQLFGKQNCIGETVWLSGNAYRVCGVFQSPLISFTQQMDIKCYVPLYSIQSSHADISQIVLKAQNPAEVARVSTQVQAILNAQAPADDAFEVVNLSKEKEVTDRVLWIIAFVISGIAIISLIVGGIGIMNIMIVTVKERQNEIGLRKALGAKNKQILGQILCEALLMSSMGGLTGCAVGYVACAVAAHFMQYSIAVQPAYFFSALLFSCGIGVLFGLYPANKAASLNPATALR